jgi:hypothetical protein
MGLSLIKSEEVASERRRLPRFPFCYLLFRPENSDHCLEVKDISQTGMQMVQKEGKIPYEEGQTIAGSVMWHGKEIEVKGKAVWCSSQSSGVHFELDQKLRQNLEDFFSVDHIVAHLRPVHEQKIGIDLPNNLKVWLKTDGPVELYIWQHNDGEVSHFQVVLWDQFLEWRDGEGIKTGKIISSRDLETPLNSENEFYFRPDTHQSTGPKIDRVTYFLEAIHEDLLGHETKSFMLRKLRK